MLFTFLSLLSETAIGNSYRVNSPLLLHIQKSILNQLPVCKYVTSVRYHSVSDFLSNPLLILTHLISQSWWGKFPNNPKNQLFHEFPSFSAMSQLSSCLTLITKSAVECFIIHVCHVFLLLAFCKLQVHNVTVIFFSFWLIHLFQKLLVWHVFPKFLNTDDCAKELW